LCTGAGGLDTDSTTSSQFDVDGVDSDDLEGLDDIDGGEHSCITEKGSVNVNILSMMINPLTTANHSRVAVSALSVSKLYRSVMRCKRYIPS
jgi:hypothetical protein